MHIIAMYRMVGERALIQRRATPAVTVRRGQGLEVPAALQVLLQEFRRGGGDVADLAAELLRLL